MPAPSPITIKGNKVAMIVQCSQAQSSPGLNQVSSTRKKTEWPHSFITQTSFLCPILSVRDTEMVLATVLYYLNVMDKETGSESLINLPKAPIQRVRILNLALYRSKVHVSSSMEVSHCT